MTRKPNEPTKLIAELGNIHLHNIENCKVAIADAFNAGADLVKLQCINPLTSYWASSQQLRRYKSIAWPIETHVEFYREMNDKYKNRVFASVFDDSYVEALSPVMPCWKVAFRMRENEPLIAKMRWSDKFIFFSTKTKFYKVDYDKYFSTTDGLFQFMPLLATDYDYRKNAEQNLVQGLSVGRYAGVSINYPAKEAISVIKYCNHLCQYIEVHVQGAGANGPDSEWALTMAQLGRLKDELG